MITLLLWYEKYLQVPGTLAHRMKALGRQQIDFSFFNELCMCLFQQQSFPISFWRATNSLFNIQGCLVGPLDCLWQSPWLDVTHAWHLKLHLVTIDEEMSNGTSVSCYLIISFRLPSICAHFGKLVLCKLFMNLQIALRFGCLSPYSLPHPPLPSFFLLDHSVSIFSSLFLYIHNYLFYFHFLGRSIHSPSHLLYT